MPIPYPSTTSTTTPRKSADDGYPSFSSSAASDTLSDASSSNGYSDDDDDYSDDEAYEAALIQQEWEASLRDMKMLVTIVLVPFFGKWMGRRWSYWGELDDWYISPACCAHDDTKMTPHGDSVRAVSSSWTRQTVLGPCMRKRQSRDMRVTTTLDATTISSLLQNGRKRTSLYQPIGMLGLYVHI